MPRKLVLGLIAAVAAVSLTGCATEVHGSEESPTEPYSVEYMEYRGETLHCNEGTGRISGCDYIRFYAEHPNLLEESEEIGKLNLAKIREDVEDFKTEKSTETSEDQESESDLEEPTPAG